MSSRKGPCVRRALSGLQQLRPVHGSPPAGGCHRPREAADPAFGEGAGRSELSSTGAVTAAAPLSVHTQLFGAQRQQQSVSTYSLQAAPLWT